MAISAVCAAVLVSGASRAQDVPMAEQPDPGSFVKRADTGLVLLGAPLRFAGAAMPWLGLRQDGQGGWQRTTAFEVRDAFLTVSALGGTVVRSASLAGSAGCALCLEPEAGTFAKDGFAALDQALKSANDLGIRLILPLAGGACMKPEDKDPASTCAYLRWHNKTSNAAFFTDPTIRADFIAHVTAVLLHVNALTGVAYRNDPAILAWENCTGCAAGADPQAAGAWTEAVGQAVKAADHFHLYENGAFAGHIRPDAPLPVRPSDFAPTSVDIVGDDGPPASDEAGLRRTLGAATSAVNAVGRVYGIDALDPGPQRFTTQDDLHLALTEIVRDRNVAIGLFSGLQGHADTGGYIQPAQPGAAAPFYFPGMDIPGLSKDDMGARDLLLRHFDFEMADVQSFPSLPLPPPPQIISAKNGKVTWRGAAGAASYAIERSADPSQPFSWELVCDQCAGGGQSLWQDPSPPSGTAYYRVMPFNQNGHKSLPSAPVRNR